MDRICPIDGTKFEVSKKSARQTCSDACAAQMRAQSLSGLRGTRPIQSEEIAVHLVHVLDLAEQIVKPHGKGMALFVARICPTCGLRDHVPVNHVRYRMRHGTFTGLCQVCSGKVNHANARAASWKGGRIVRKDGYVRVFTDDLEHPALQHKNARGGYVLEHRYAMEQHLGRYLHAHENVHHKNGVKGDNRLENLELWITQQPRGQRYEDVRDWWLELASQYPEWVQELNRT